MGSNPTKENAVIIRYIVGREKVRLADIRQRKGETGFAEGVGETVVANQVIMMSPDLREVGASVIASMENDLVRISQDPSLSQSLVTGVLKGLRERHFFEK